MDDVKEIDPCKPVKTRNAFDRKPPDKNNENAGPVTAGTGVGKKKAMWAYCPSSYKMGHQSGLIIGGSGSFV